MWLNLILLNYQSQIDALKKQNNKIIEVLQKDRKFWVDNEKNIHWGKIENISEEIRNSKPIKKKLGLIKYLCKPSSWGNIKLSNLEVFL